MFPHRYFGLRYYANTYFAESQGAAPPAGDTVVQMVTLQQIGNANLSPL